MNFFGIDEIGRRARRLSCHHVWSLAVLVARGTASATRRRHGARRGVRPRVRRRRDAVVARGDARRRPARRRRRRRRDRRVRHPTRRGTLVVETERPRALERLHGVHPRRGRRRGRPRQPPPLPVHGLQARRRAVPDPVRARGAVRRRARARRGTHARARHAKGHRGLLRDHARARVGDRRGRDPRRLPPRVLLRRHHRVGLGLLARVHDVVAALRRRERGDVFLRRRPREARRHIARDRAVQVVARDRADVDVGDVLRVHTERGEERGEGDLGDAAAAVFAPLFFAHQRVHARRRRRGVGVLPLQVGLELVRERRGVGRRGRADIFRALHRVWEHARVRQRMRER